MLTPSVIKTASHNYFMVVTLGKLYNFFFFSSDRCADLNKLVCYSSLCTMFNLHWHSLPMSQKVDALSLTNYSLKKMGMLFLCFCDLNH
jgi:hypothetical protein